MRGCGVAEALECFLDAQLDAITLWGTFCSSKSVGLRTQLTGGIGGRATHLEFTRAYLRLALA
jgi:hypothetical protein